MWTSASNKDNLIYEMLKVAVALQLKEPWKLVHIEFDEEEDAWHLFLDFERGALFRIMELVEKRIVELGIVRLPIDTRLFDMISLPDEPIVVAMSEKWDIGKDRAYIKLSELEGKPLMLPRRQKGTSIYNHQLYITDMVETACLQHGFEPRIVCESSDITTLLNWAIHDIGITTVPRSAMNIIPNSGLIFKEIREPEIMARPSVVIWLKGRYLSTISRKFMESFPVNKSNAAPD